MVLTACCVVCLQESMAHEIFFVCLSSSNKNKKFLKGYSVLILMYI